MSTGSNALRSKGLRNDRQVDGYTSIDIEREGCLGLVHVISDTVVTDTLAIFLVTERPQVVVAVSGEVVILYISSAISGLPGVLPRGRQGLHCVRRSLHCWADDNALGGKAGCEYLHGRLTTPHQTVAGGGLGVAPDTKKKGISLSGTWVATSHSGGAAVIPPLAIARLLDLGLASQDPT